MSKHEVGLKGPRPHEVRAVKMASEPRILEVDEFLRGIKWAKVSIGRPGRVVPLPDETSSQTDGSSEGARWREVRRNTSGQPAGADGAGGTKQHRTGRARAERTGSRPMPVVSWFGLSWRSQAELSARQTGVAPMPTD